MLYGPKFGLNTYIQHTPLPLSTWVRFPVLCATSDTYARAQSALFLTYFARSEASDNTVQVPSLRLKTEKYHYIYQTPCISALTLSFTTQRKQLMIPHWFKLSLKLVRILSVSTPNTVSARLCGVALALWPPITGSRFALITNKQVLLWPCDRSARLMKNLK